MTLIDGPNATRESDAGFRFSDHGTAAAYAGRGRQIKIVSGDGGIPRLINACRADVAVQLVLTAELIDARRAWEINLVSRVAAHDPLMEEAERIARQILRNDQAAVRSAKRTLIDMIGRRLDDQLRIEAINGYTCMTSGREVRDRLKQFYDRGDPNRMGADSAAA